MQLSEEVWNHIEEWLKNGGKGPLDPNIGTIEIMAEHPGIDGVDVDFYVEVTRDGVRNEYHRQAKRFKANGDDPDPQLILDGFVRLQRAYLIDRLYETEVEYDKLNGEERKRVNNAALQPLKRSGRLYIVERPKAVLVKIEHLTDDELDQKESEYRHMAQGCIQHANEIVAYRRARKAAI